jgi:hypothetical protein
VRAKASKRTQFLKSGGGEYHELTAVEIKLKRGKIKKKPRPHSTCSR